jgi:NADH-quinone oxidoreductase subunit A
MASPTTVAAYIAFFATLGFLFLFVTLVVGYFLRPREPNREKLEVYECGEPTIGSSFVQFDLRFYVVALLFIIFDVEVAFFFPWATVYGKATHLMDPNFQTATVQGELTPHAKALFKELGDENPTVPPLPESLAAASQGLEPQQKTSLAVSDLGRRLALFSIIDIAVFFAVLLVGFAYVWRRGDLDWVRALSKQRALEARPRAPALVSEEQPVVSA